MKHIYCSLNSLIFANSLLDNPASYLHSWWLERAWLDDQGLFYYKAGIFQSFENYERPHKCLSTNQITYQIFTWVGLFMFYITFTVHNKSLTCQNGIPSNRNFGSYFQTIVWFEIHNQMLQYKFKVQNNHWKIIQK